MTPLPKGQPFYVLTEYEGNDAAGDGDRVEAALAGALEAGDVTDAVIAKTEKEARDFWTVREGLALERLPHIVNYDVSLAIGRIGEFADRCRAALAKRWPDGTFHLLRPYRRRQSAHLRQRRRGGGQCRA